MLRKIGTLSMVALMTVVQQSVLVSDAYGVDDCVTVTLDYESYIVTPYNDKIKVTVWPDWTASAWYTPCGKPANTPQSGQSTWHARSNTGNTVRIAKGSPLKIGPQGINVNYIDIQPNAETLKDLTIRCGGSILSRNFPKYPWCKVW